MSESSSKKSISLPAVNYGDAIDESDAERRHCETSKLIDAFTNVGFVTIENIDGYDEEELFTWIKWFYYQVTPQVFSIKCQKALYLLHSKR